MRNIVSGGFTPFLFREPFERAPNGSFINRLKTQQPMERIGGPRRKTRSKMTKHFRRKGKISLSRYFQAYKEGDNILLDMEPSVHHGMFHGRFLGKPGIVKRKNGRCYEVLFKDGDKEKMLIVHAVHLRKLQ